MFMRYFRAKEAEKQHEIERDAYICLGVQLITEYTAKFVGGNRGLRDWGKHEEPADERTGDEIALEIIMKHGLKVKNESV